MADKLLQVNGISVRVEDKEILHDINLEIGKGETHVLMGPNGAGKSTLGYALMGNPKYEVMKGDILFRGNRINEDGADKRARDGIFLSFQSPLEVPGLSLSSFIRNAVEKRRGSRIRLWDFKKELQKEMELLQMDSSYAERDLNSGLDVDAVRTVSKGVEEYQKTRDGALLIITHSTRILEALHVDYTHVLVDGHIVKTGDASLIDEINEHGFEKYLDLLKQESETGR